MGVRFALVDVWLGFVERLYVSDKPKQVVRVRRRRVEPGPSAPGWQDVLYRGAAATASGEYVSESAGMFRILADVPEAPVDVQPAGDRPRCPPGYGRRATDRVGGQGDGAGRREGTAAVGRRAGDRPIRRRASGRSTRSAGK